MTNQRLLLNFFIGVFILKILPRKNRYQSTSPIGKDQSNKRNRFYSTETNQSTNKKILSIDG